MKNVNEIRRVPVRKCVGCGNSFMEDTDHEYCTPECYLKTSREEEVLFHKLASDEEEVGDADR